MLCFNPLNQSRPGFEADKQGNNHSQPVMVFEHSRPSTKNFGGIKFKSRNLGINHCFQDLGSKYCQVIYYYCFNLKEHNLTFLYGFAFRIWNSFSTVSACVPLLFDRQFFVPVDRLIFHKSPSCPDTAMITSSCRSWRDAKGLWSSEFAL